jgi:hypothetical protein
MPGIYAKLGFRATFFRAGGREKAFASAHLVRAYTTPADVFREPIAKFGHRRNRPKALARL